MSEKAHTSELVADLRDAYAVLGYVVLIQDEAGEEFWTGKWPAGDPSERVPSLGVYFESTGDEIDAGRVSLHSTVTEFGCSWPAVGRSGFSWLFSGEAFRRYTNGRAVPLEDVRELVRCLRVEAETSEGPSWFSKLLARWSR